MAHALLIEGMHHSFCRLRPRGFLLTSVLLATLFASASETLLEANPSDVFADIRKNATPDELYSLLFAMPKGGDLHHHGAGSVPMEYVVDYYRDREKNGGQDFYIRTRIEFCPDARLRPEVMFHVLRESQWLKLDPCLQTQFEPVESLTETQVAAWLSDLKIDEASEGRDEFFEKIWWRLGPCFSDLTIGPELLVENMKSLGKEGIRYLEIQTIPWASSEHNGDPIEAEVWYETYKKRLAQPDAVATGVTVRFQVVIIRFLEDAEDHVRRAFAFIDSHRDLFVGINLAGREDDGKGQAARFTEVFREMQRKYPRIPLSIHAGESDEANSNIHDTLLLGADRIGHGLNLLKDPDTYLLLRNNRYLVETNLVSNKLLEYVLDPQDHPFPVFLRTGVPVCLNTDDRGMWDSTFSDEYYTAVSEYNLSWEEIVKVGRASLEYAFVDDSTKETLLAEYDSRIAGYEDVFLVSDWRAVARTVQPIVSNYGKQNFGLTLPVTMDQEIP